MPFAAALLGQHIHNRLAALIYGANLSAIASIHAGAWAYATGRSLVGPQHRTRAFLRSSRRLAWLAAAGHATGTLVAALSASAATAIYAAVPSPFVTGIFYRLVQTHARIDGASHPGAPPADVTGSR